VFCTIPAGKKYGLPASPLSLTMEPFDADADGAPVPCEDSGFTVVLEDWTI